MIEKVEQSAPMQLPIPYIGLPLRNFKAVKQQDPSGCWAASLIMICRFYEVNIDEQSEMDPSNRHQNDTGCIIAERLAGTRRIDGRPFVAKPLVVETWKAILPYLTAALSRQQPVFLGLREMDRIPHAVVAVGAELDGQRNIQRVVVADPGDPPYWDHSPTVIELADAVHEAVFVWDPMPHSRK
jgi:hypothetical protein